VLQTPDVDDPRRDELAAAATEAIAKNEPSAFFNIPGLFPPALVEDAAWRNRLNRDLRATRNAAEPG
jgi:fructuronate reductase